MCVCVCGLPRQNQAKVGKQKNGVGYTTGQSRCLPFI